MIFFLCITDITSITVNLEMTEQVFDLVKAYPVGRNLNSLVVSIPKEVREALGIKAHQMLHVIIDERGRLIYETVEGAHAVGKDE